VLIGYSGRPLFFIIRLSGNLHRVPGCFFHGAINVFEGFVEAAGRNPAAFNKFNNDFFGSSQYLFVDGRHITAPLPRKLLSKQIYNESGLLLKIQTGVKAIGLYSPGNFEVDSKFQASIGHNRRRTIGTNVLIDILL
jgi:hypothetical protein